MRQVAQAQPHHFTQRMRDLGQFFAVQFRVELDVAQRIEVFHRQIQLLGEELRRVRHARRATREEQAIRRRPALLTAVKLDGLVDLNVQPGEHLSGNLGNRRLMGTVRFLVGATQAHEAFGNLDLLGFVELQLGFLGEILRDGIGPDVNAARVNIALLEEQQVAGLGTDVQQHGAAFEVAVVVAEGVAQRSRRDIDDLQAQTGTFRRLEQAFDHVFLDGDEQHLEFAGGSGAEDLIIPHDFLQREGDILLRLVLDDLCDLGGIDRGQLDELGEGVETRRADIDVASFRSDLGQQLIQRLAHGGVARGFLRTVLAERAKTIAA